MWQRFERLATFYFYSYCSIFGFLSYFTVYDGNFLIYYFLDCAEESRDLGEIMLKVAFTDQFVYLVCVFCFFDWVFVK